MDIAAALATVSNVTDVLKTLRSIERGYDAATLKAEIIDLMDRMLDVRTALQDARDAINQKDELIARLRSAKDLKSLTVETRGYRYRQKAEDPAQPAEHGRRPAGA